MMIRNAVESKTREDQLGFMKEEEHAMFVTRGCREEEMDIEKTFDADSDSVYFDRRFNIVINNVKIHNTRSGRLPLRHNMSLAWEPL